MTDHMHSTPNVWQIAHGRSLPLDEPRIIGVLNVTPDSFSDGGRFADARAAVDHGLRMIEEGASIIDIGGESTRPGARRMPAHTQISRVVPVLRRLRALGGDHAALSIDTTHCAVARAAIDAGASIINDVSACTEDPAMVEVAAGAGVGLILMHRLRPPQNDSFSDQYAEPPQYKDVVGDVRAFLRQRVEHVTAAGVGHQNIVVDPGLGFGKTVDQNYQIADRIDEFGLLGERRYPVLSAASRKSFIGSVCGVAEPAHRVAGSVAISVAHFLRGVRLFRVHDVRAHREALAVAAAMAGGR